MQNNDPVLSKYLEQFVDEETGEPVKENDTNGVKAVFYDGKVLDEEVSILSNRAIFRPAEFVRKTVRGSIDVIDRVVRPEDLRAYPKEYAAFQASKEQRRWLDGTPLATCTWLSPAQAGELAYLRIHTLQQLAEAPEAKLAEADEAKALVIESLSRDRPQQAHQLRQVGPLLPLWRQARERLSLSTAPAPQPKKRGAASKRKRARTKNTGAKPLSVKGGR